MNAEPSISVIIPYRNWGAERLKLAVEAHLQSTIAADIEIIVSDFGSAQEHRADVILRGLPIRSVYTATDEPWSRSRALNAGISCARGSHIIAWDADIICAPTLHAEVLDHFRVHRNAAYVFQCRDLKPTLGEPELREHLDTYGTLPLDELRAQSSWRPRWGMGIAAYRRDHWALVRGYDERMVVWGGEDKDLMHRFSRLGIAVRWIESDAAEIYHIYHESSQQEAQSSVEGQAALIRNSEYVKHDRTIFRNLVEPRYFRSNRPLISVIIATRNRAEFLGQALQSVFDQTFRDFEVIVIDDGSEDGTPQLLGSISDPRLHCFSQTNQGVAAARNAGIRAARGHFVVVHDDDDIMLPYRLEAHLNAVKGNVVGSYGGWVDFDGATGEFVDVNSGKDFSDASIAYAGKVLLHPTVMVTRAIAEHIPYDERHRGGSDFNWMMTIAASGAQLVHTGNIHILRRLHAARLTAAPSVQQHASRATVRAINGALGAAGLNQVRAQGRAATHQVCLQEADLESLYTFLPDDLKVSRARFRAACDVRQLARLAEALERAGDAIKVTVAEPVSEGGVTIRDFYVVQGIAKDPAAVEGCLGPVCGFLEHWHGFMPKAVDALPSLAPRAVLRGGDREAPTTLATAIDDSSWAALRTVAQYYALEPGTQVLAVTGTRPALDVGKVERALAASWPKDTIQRLCTLEATTGAVILFHIDEASFWYDWINRASSTKWFANVSLVVHEVGRLTSSTTASPLETVPN